MGLVKELREAAHRVPPDVHDLLNRAAEEIEMLRASFDDEDSMMHEAIKEAIRNERSACATVAEEVGCAEGAMAIRNRPPV